MQIQWENHSVSLIVLELCHNKHLVKNLRWLLDLERRTDDSDAG